MSTTLTATIKISISGSYVNDLDLSDVTDQLSQSLQQAFANGAGANQASVVYHDRVTVTASGSNTLDLSGSLTDGLGQAVSLTKLKALIVKNNSTGDKLTMGNATNPVLIFGAGAHTFPIFPGGIFVGTWPTADGVTVTGGSADELKFVHEGVTSTDATMDIYIFGA